MTPTKLMRVNAARRAERKAATRYDDARERFEQELRVAAAQGASVRELADATGLAKSAVHRIVK